MNVVFARAHDFRAEVRAAPSVGIVFGLKRQSVAPLFKIRLHFQYVLDFVERDISAAQQGALLLAIFPDEGHSQVVLENFCLRFLWNSHALYPLSPKTF